MDKDFQDRIDDYILSRMSDEDRYQFENEIAQDEARKNQLEFTRNIKIAIKSRQDKMAMLEQMKIRYDRDKKAELPKSESASTKRLDVKKISKHVLWSASGFAAVLIIGLLVVNRPAYDSDPLFEVSGGAALGAPNDNNQLAPGEIVNDTIPKDTVKVIIAIPD